MGPPGGKTNTSPKDGTEEACVLPPAQRWAPPRTIVWGAVSPQRAVHAAPGFLPEERAPELRPPPSRMQAAVSFSKPHASRPLLMPPHSRPPRMWNSGRHCPHLSQKRRHLQGSEGPPTRQKGPHGQHKSTPRWRTSQTRRDGSVRPVPVPQGP